jgi:L-2-hydroxyglutarate oxidase
MRTYCLDRDVPMVQNGILVVANREEERPRLATMLRQGRDNGADVRLTDAAGIRELEPHAVGIEALVAPEGASVDPVAYTRALVDDAGAAGCDVRFGARVRRVEENAWGPIVVRTGYTRRSNVTAKVVVNCAGLHADRIAGHVADGLRIVPFRGSYADVVGESRDLVRGHVYAVPDPALPFLGIHLSRSPDGRLKAGPRAILAAGRHAYGRGTMHPRDIAASLGWPGFWRMWRGPVGKAAPVELARAVSLRRVAADAQRLVPALRAQDLRRAPAGIRAQVIGRDGTLVEDMVVRETERTVHVLNAVSPGLTASLPFGEHVAKLALAKL